MTSRVPLACIVPPYLLRQLAAAYPEAAGRFEWMVQHDDDLRLRRSVVARERAAAAAAGAGTAWAIHTARNGSTLPGDLVRSAGDAASGDPAVDEAADGIAGALAMYAEVYGRDSYDGKGAQVVGTVHYEQGYDNAFWNGTELIFGDGDGVSFGRFTQAVDVLGHELTHAVTERTAALAYEGQPGALNESVSDVFGSCLKQRQLGQTAAEGDWLIGAGLFLPSVQGRALRDMAHPGTAYDDPKLGKDPQPADMDHYVDTTDDNGGVHINSGVPNRAFYLAASAIGGTSAEGAGRIWYAALTGGQVGAQTDFAGFAAATVAAAGADAAAVRDAWHTVGVTPAESTAAPGVLSPREVGRAEPLGVAEEATGRPASRVVRVRRTGGFAGRAVEAEVDLDSGDARASELVGLVDRLASADLEAARMARPMPDMYVYHFDLGDRLVTAPENGLTPDLRRVADLVLSGGS